ncbi:hypothetical protein CWB96_17860 [Pseudoalteromonas citrea]|uniref:Sel1 repeat family protein n=1 Tax=Pseudoalteromonas citrea TaxID=43655 RepID=A0A5S3XM88_9GAMM|nr:hypothetical protein [Pseudoalteromonas citrea]TMP42282.1 hypothetical protein CWB97_12210 [Pseudoalteromonas citrea]TMP55156.1 hypothetical protein CWB96_17860 [Pseudoalteromonas citrea]
MRLTLLLLVVILSSASAYACEGLSYKQEQLNDDAIWSPYLRRGMKYFGNKEDKKAIACFKKTAHYEPGIANIRIATVYHLRYKSDQSNASLRKHAISYYNKGLEYPENISVNFIRTQLKKLLVTLSNEEITQLQNSTNGTSRYNYFNAGLYHVDNANPIQALHYLKLAADDKYWPAKLLLGQLYNPALKYNATFIPFSKDLKKATYWLKKAHTQAPTKMLERQLLHLEEYKKSLHTLHEH